MVYCCSVIGCYNLRGYNNRRSPASPRVIRNEVDQGVRFFRFPTWKRHHGPQMEELTKRRRLAWLSAVRRKDLTFHDIPPQRRVCSRHFHKGKPAMEMFESDPDWAPSLHLDGSDILHIFVCKEKVPHGQERSPSLPQEEPEPLMLAFKATKDQCVESRLQVKMNSPDSARDISIQQEEPEDHPHLNILHMFVCKEEVPHGQERSPSLPQEEPEPLHIKEQEEILQRPEEPDGSMLTFLAVKSEVDKDISSHFSEVEVELEYDTAITDDNDDWRETERVHRLHTKEKRFHCKHCNKNFTQSSHLASHQYSHTGERPFQCKQCDKSFTWSASLKRHQHVHSHTGEKRFLCTHCDKIFASSENLRRHELGYTGYRPHPCTLCDKRFIMSADLKLHQRVHTGEKPFQCKHCDKRFTWRSSLKSHRCICNGVTTQLV